MTQKNKKVKDREMEFAIINMKKAIKKNYKSKPEWEDKHPFLAFLMVIGILLLNPVSLFIIGIFSILGLIIYILGGLI